ncbi:MAG: sodium/proline symporter [Gammaproteobacteria bacterium]|nr:sodium/proline symporter [Gammaproteobacteria bacterium]
MASEIILLSFSVFVVIFLGVGVFAAKRSAPTDVDYLLGSRSFGTWFVGLSAGATGNSGFIMLGAVGMGYTMGLSGVIMGLAWFLGDLTFWSFFPEKFNRMARDRDCSTIPELLSSGIPGRGSVAIRQLAGLLIVVLIGAYTAAQFSAAAKTLNVFFDLDMNIGIIVSALAILAYCTTGGLRASLWTDVVQAIIMLGITTGMLTVAYVSAGGFSAIQEGLHAIDPTLTEITGTFTTWTLIAFVVGYASAGFGFGISQPQLLVRLLAGRSPEETRKAKWIYVLFIQYTWHCMALFGMAARLLIPGIDDPEQALPMFAFQNFDPWLVGVVLAGIFSAIASTADSQVLVSSSSLAIDVAPGFYKKMSARFGVRYQQVVTLVVGMLAALAAIFFSSSVFALIIFALSMLASSLGPAMFNIILKRPTNALAIGSCMVVGLVVAVGWRMLGYNETLNESLPGFLAGLVVHDIIVRLRSAKREPMNRSGVPETR